MAVRGHISYLGSPETVAKALNPAVRSGLRDVVEAWHKDTLPKHFEPGAVSRYHYQPRSKRHEIRKAKRFHHRNPLQFSGTLRREVSRQVRISVTASRGGMGRARGVMTGPKYLYQYRKDYGQPDKAAELTMVTASEVEAMARALDHSVTVKLREVRELDEVHF